jgi:poly(3-hydroxybutyrate) depolymerase
LTTRKIVIGAIALIICLPVVLVLIAWGSFYTMLSLYASNRTNGAIVSSGEKRDYLLYVPKSYDRTKPTPLVISMHAAMNWPAFQAKASQWNKVADENGFIVVYPAGMDPLRIGPIAWRRPPMAWRKANAGMDRRAHDQQHRCDKPHVGVLS